VISSSFSLISFSMLFFLASNGPEFSSSPFFFFSSSSYLFSLSTLCCFFAILMWRYFISPSNFSTSRSFSFNSFIKSSSFFWRSSFWDCVLRLSIRTREISLAMSSISTSFFEIYSYATFVCFIKSSLFSFSHFFAG
jgi:hypothetical protein